MKITAIRFIITLAMASSCSASVHAYHNISPYAWCACNPVAYVDLNGMDSIYACDRHGNLQYLADDGKDTGNRYVVNGEKQVRRGNLNIAPENNKEVLVLPNSSVWEGVKCCHPFLHRLSSDMHEYNNILPWALVGLAH